MRKVGAGGLGRTRGGKGGVATVHSASRSMPLFAGLGTSGVPYSGGGGGGVMRDITFWGLVPTSIGEWRVRHSPYWEAREVWGAREVWPNTKRAMGSKIPTGLGSPNCTRLCAELLRPRRHPRCAWTFLFLS